MSKKTCPVAAISAVLGKPWILEILYNLSSPRRYRELQRLSGGPSPSVLSSRLRVLERVGLLTRRVLSTIPPAVEYSLTPMGHDLMPILDQLVEWSKKWQLQETAVPPDKEPKKFEAQ